MSVSRPTRKQIATVALATTLALVVSYWTTMWSFSYSSTNKFCISCHEMVEPFEKYRTSSHYNNPRGVVAGCADCHLPPAGFSKWYAKITQGATDTVMHFLLNPEDIDHEEWKRLAVKNIKAESCLQCHKNLLPPELPKGGLIAHRAYLRGEAGKTCLRCHENLVH